MSKIETRYVARDELSAEQAWSVLAWCVARGATEFTLGFLGTTGDEATRLHEAEHALAPFRARAAPRERMTIALGQPRVQPTDLWALSDESIGVLRHLLPAGPLGRPEAGASGGWIEDLTVYRGGDLMFGVSSHEGLGVLMLTPAERRALTDIGLPTHTEPGAIR